MVDASLLILSFPVFHRVIIEELFALDVVLDPAEELFLYKSLWALTHNIDPEIDAKIINIEVKDTTKINLLFIVYTWGISFISWYIYSMSIVESSKIMDFVFNIGSTKENFMRYKKTHTSEVQLL